MDEFGCKHERIIEILTQFQQDTRFDEVDAEDIKQLGADIRQVITLDPDFLIWIKTREVRCSTRGAKEIKMAAKADGRRVVLHIFEAIHRSGMVDAYQDVCREILFPGRSVQEGTLDPDVAASADKEWTEKAEEELRKMREG